MLEGVAGLIEKGVAVETVIPDAGELGDKLSALGVTVHTIPCAWWVAYSQWSGFDYRLKRLARNLYFSRRLYRLLKRIKPDLVVSNTLTIPAGAFAAKLAGIPHIWFVHEFGREGHGFHFDFGERRTFSLMNKLSARIMVNSRAVAQSLQAHISPEKLQVVYQAVEVPPSNPSHTEPSTFLRLICVGRLAAGKRQEDAIRALAILIGRGLKLQLVLVGPDVLNYGSMLRDLAHELEVSQCVAFAGFAANPSQHVAAADVALVCSQGEAFGRVTIEAMKAGKPVVGANSAGTAELISDGVNGFTFATGDAEDLARKIEILYHDPSLRKEMGRSGQAWAVENFSREKFGADLLRIFKEVVLPA